MSASICVLTSGPMTISAQRGTSCRGPEVKTQKCTGMHKYVKILSGYVFIVLYLLYVIYYACRFEKLLRAYVILL